MLIDSNLLFDPSATAITASADSTNVIDFGGPGVPASPQGRDIAIGKKLSVRVCCQTAFTAAGAATLQVQIKAAPDSSGSPGTYILLAQTDAIPKANLIAGAFIELPIPPMPPQGETLPPEEARANLPRFYKLSYVVGTGPFTAGTVESFIVGEMADNNQAYPSNFVAV